MPAARTTWCSPLLNARFPAGIRGATILPCALGSARSPIVCFSTTVVARRRAAVLELLGRGAKAEHPSLERGAAARSVIQALDRLPEAQRHLFALGVRGGPELPRGGRASWRARRHRDVAIVACPRATSAGEGSFNLHRQSLHPTQCGQVRVDVDQPAGRH